MNVIIRQLELTPRDEIPYLFPDLGGDKTVFDIAVNG